MTITTIKTPSLNGDKIAEQYPLSVAAFRKWLGLFPNQEVLSVSGDDEQIYMNSLKAIFYYNPRALYEFFDQAGIVLIVRPFQDHWTFVIAETGENSIAPKTRIDAEEQGFQQCFEILEKRLKG